MDATFGEVIRRRRVELGLQAQEVARRVEITRAYYSTLETGRAGPPAPDKLARLAEVLALPLDELEAAARRLPGDVAEALWAQPRALFELIRAVEGLDEATVRRIARRARARRR